MKCVITGANGFIGSYLCDFLQNRNYSVIAISKNFSDELRKGLKKCEFLEENVLKESFKDIKISADVLIHLATPNDIISKDTIKGIELSTIGTKNTLEFTLNNKVPYYILFSTAQVYGTELNGTCTEDTPPKPESDYGINHLFAEMYVQMYARKTRLKCSIVRPSNIYGRFISPAIDRWTLVPGYFCRQAFNEERIVLKSSGKQKRNFVSLENICIATETLLKRSPDEDCEIVNFSSSAANLSILEVAEIVKKVYEKMYGKELDLIINSDHPKRSNSFKYSIEKVVSYGFKEEHTCSLEKEVEKIFKLLEIKSENNNFLPIEKFIKERSKRVIDISNNEELKNKSLNWMIYADKYKYTYNFSWLERPIIKYPQDIVAMQEIIWKIKPDLIIETGIAHGGSIILSASILELLQKGEVVAVDIDIRKHNKIRIQQHPMAKRITMIEGSSVNMKVFQQIAKYTNGKKTVMVCLDSNHTHDHVLRELQLYSQLVTVNSYLILPDTLIEYFPKGYYNDRSWDVGDSPMSALREFQKKNDNFIVDNELNNKLLITEALGGGYLKRVK